MPLMNMVSNGSGNGMVESDEDLQPSIMSYRELEKGKECLRNSFKVTICPTLFVNIPLGCGPNEGSLKEA